jgi:hypothetical protein
MAIAGLRGTGDWGVDERPTNFREMILWRSPNGQAPLTALLSKMRSETTSDPQFSWWEEELNALRLTTTGEASDTDTLLTITSNITDGTDIVAGDIFLVEKDLTPAFDHEIVVATTNGQVGEVQVQRGALGTTAAPIESGSSLTKIGNAFAEGTGAPDASMRNPTKLFNLTQIFKTTYDITRTASDTSTRTGDPIKNDKKRKLFDHSVAMELAWFFGKRFETTGPNGKPLRTTGGLLYFLSQYAPQMITVFNSTPTETSFTDAVYKVFDYQTQAGNERIVFAGNGFLNSLNRLAATQARTRVNFNGIINVYGMELQKWILPQGTIYVKSHPLFNTHARFTNDAAIIDPSSLRYRYMKDTTFKDHIELPDEDAQKGQWLTEAGLEVEHAKTMGWISNFIV